VHLNTELMFLPSRMALSHSVYFGKAGLPMLHLEDLSGPTANIARLHMNLEPNTHYAWRVDTHTIDGVKTGEQWTLMTGAGNQSCKISPHPPPQPTPDKPPPPGPGQCPKACNQLCPGLVRFQTNGLSAGWLSLRKQPCFVSAGTKTTTRS
jgi:hypothetical protein